MPRAPWLPMLLFVLGAHSLAEAAAPPRADDALLAWAREPAKSSQRAVRPPQDFELLVRCFNSREELGPERFGALVRQLLEDQENPSLSAESKRRGLFLLGRLQDSAALPLLTKRAREPGPAELRAEAVDALAYFGSRSKRDSFLNALPTARMSPDLCAQVREVVFRPAPDARATEALLAVLGPGTAPIGCRPGDEDPDLRCAALKALEFHPGPSLEEFGLAAKTLHGRPRMMFLAAAGTPKSIAAIAEYLHTEPQGARRFAVESLGTLARPEAARALLGALDDTDEEVRALAARALFLMAGVDVPMERIVLEDIALLRAGFLERWGPHLERFEPSRALPAEPVPAPCAYGSR
ncbi:HEAT repeat domain-containing protein [Archangium lansingense]|uniref:HEAT repeat domain-containing protein n=1 Tax=Archangium lansingense TaxID=2995310 RepID=UPI003B7DBC8B